MIPFSLILVANYEKVIITDRRVFLMKTPLRLVFEVGNGYS